MPARSPADIIRQFVEYLSSGQLDELAALYEPDAVYFARPSQPLTGDRIRTAFGRLIERSARMVAECERVVEAGGLALVNNRWSITVVSDTRAIEAGGVSIVVARQRADGTWGVLIDDPWAECKVG